MILLDTLEIPLDKFIGITIHPDTAKITQTDYLQAIQFVLVDKATRAALDQIKVDGEHRLDTWTVTGKGVYVGSWSKRLSKYLHKEHNIKIAPKQLSIITERVRRTLDGVNEELFLMFSKEMWEPGTFGESAASCWFPGRAYGYSAPALLAEENGGAIKLFDTDLQPRARCWYYNLDGSLLVFNAYDKRKRLDILSIARLVSLHFGMDYYRHTDVYMPNTYINGKSIYSIGNPPLTRPVTMDFAFRHQTRFPSLHPDPILDVPPNNVRVCPTCRMQCHELYKTADGVRCCEFCSFACDDCHSRNLLTNDGSSAARYTHDSRRICQICAPEYTTCANCDFLFMPEGEETTCPGCGEGFECSECHETAFGDTYRLPDGDRICDDCYSDYYHTCERCDDVVHTDNTVWLDHESVTLCEDCYNDVGCRCAHCDTTLYVTNSVASGDDNYCQPCADDHLYNCERCGDYHLPDDTVMVVVDDDENEETWCGSCAENYASLCEECSQYFTKDLGHEHEEEDDDET